MASPTASPQVASTVGLKNVVIAPLMEDSETTHTYGTLQLMAGAIEASITPENADPDVQHADDVEFSVLYPDPELSFKTKMADIPLTIQEMIFGNAIDDNGVLVRTASDRPPYFAVGFKSEKSDGTFRYVWLFKVRAKPVTETYATKEGTSVTRQTGEAPMTGAIRPWPMKAKTASTLRRPRPFWSPSTSRPSRRKSPERDQPNLYGSTPLAGSQPAAVCFCLMGGETDGAGSPEAKWAQPAAWRL